MGQRDEREPEQPKSFLEEAFEHRQRDLGSLDDVSSPPEEDAVDADDSGRDKQTLTPAAGDDSSRTREAQAIGDERVAAVDATPAVPPPAPPAPPTPLQPAEHALVDEALKKSGLIWLRTPTAPTGQAVWHVWLDDAVYLVTGGDEQPDPGLLPGAPATVVVRSKETASRLVAFEAIVEDLKPDAVDWVAATDGLAKTRLNLRDGGAAAARWASDPTYHLYRLRPIGPLVEGPGAYPADSHRSAPVPTTATTAGPKPKVLHRRHGSGRPLS